MTRSYSCYKTDNTFFNFILKNLCGFWGHCLKIVHICMDFKPCFKVYNFVSVYLKSIKLGQITTLNVIFHVVVSIYRLVKIWNLPQFAAQFWNGQLGVKGKQIRKVLFAIGQGKKKHTEHAKHILEKMQPMAFLEFKALHSDLEIKQRKFESLFVGNM